MNFSREQADDLNRVWDKVMAENPAIKAGLDQATKLHPMEQAYRKQIEAEDAPKSTPDINLSTAFVLLSSWGFSPDTNDKSKEGKVRAKLAEAGQVMIERAEAHLPRTFHQLYGAMESARRAGNTPSEELFHQVRGMILMLGAWGYVIDRTHQLEVRDNDIYVHLAEFSTTLPESAERARLTKAAENRMEQTTGLLLQAIDSAQRHMARTVRLMMTGALMMLYALSNAHFGAETAYLGDAEVSAPEIVLPS